MFDIILSGETASSDPRSNFVPNFFLDVNELGDVIEISDEFITQSCSIPFDVKTVFPNWLVEEHELGNTKIVKFFQHYYDWLYCTDVSGLYTNNIETLQDISNINEYTVDAFNNSFVPQVNLNSDVSLVKEFLINFKRDILARKGTPEGTALFFTKLFPEVISVQIEQGVLTENITLYTNEPRSEQEYINAYNSLMKPIGIKTTIQPAIPRFGSETDEAADDAELNERLAGKTGFGGATAIAFEVPLLGNYYVYRLRDDTTIDPNSGCSGSSHIRAIAGNTADMPTHTHPNSIIGPQGSGFGNINIYEFIYMPYTDANEGITSC